MKKNDLVTLKIEDCTIDGSGVGKYDGMAIFVPETAVNDEIVAHILKVKKSYAFAKAERVISPSKDRIKPECEVSHRCGGCVFNNISYEAELKIKEKHVKDCLKRIGGVLTEVSPIIPSDEHFRYRNKAQFPVAEENGEIISGFFSQRSHNVIKCNDCLLQPIEFAKIVMAFIEYMKKNHVSVYSEKENKGLVRHIYLRKGFETGEVMVCPVINGYNLPNENELIQILKDSCESISSIVINTNVEKTNVVLGKECRTIYGQGYISEVICGLKFRLSPLSFFQVNRQQAEKLYLKAREYADLNGSETLIDLYCGTGTIGMTMAENAGKVIGVEVIPQAIEDAKLNAKENHIGNIEFLCADASLAVLDFKKRGVTPNVVILDPPRKGCAREVIDCISEMSPERVVYISCDPATLARDLKIFEENSYYAQKITPVDLFPRTAHVETVVLMSKVKPQNL